MAAHLDLVALMRAVGAGERAAAEQALVAAPLLSQARIQRTEEFFLERCGAEVYAGDTALRAAAFAHDTRFARRLVEAGADVRARNRRGGEPLHAATIGNPGSSHWDPEGLGDGRGVGGAEGSVFGEDRRSEALSDALVLSRARV